MQQRCRTKRTGKSDDRSVAKRRAPPIVVHDRPSIDTLNFSAISFGRSAIAQALGRFRRKATVFREQLAGGNAFGRFNVKALRNACWTAHIAERNYQHCPRCSTLSKGNQLARFQVTARFCSPFVHMDAPSVDLFNCQPACLEKTSAPQPLVETNCGGSLLNRASHEEPSYAGSACDFYPRPRCICLILSVVPTKSQLRGLQVFAQSGSPWVGSSSSDHWQKLNLRARDQVSEHAVSS
jgi:hypothetical protein